MNELDLMTAFGVLFENAAEAMAEVVTDGVFAASQEQVPKDTLALMESGQVSGPVIEIGQATVIISYGDPSDSTGIYSIIQHEDMALNHPNGGNAKYLELPLLDAATTFLAQVAAKMGGR